jgi:AcrR family transcriptional regulator
MSFSAPAAHAEPARTRRTQAERRNESEHALLDAAVRLFAARGIDRTSLAEIGEEAGYSRGLVNHHFGSKAALVERLAERSQRHFAASLGAGSSGGDAMTALADAYLTAVATATAELRAFFVMWGAALPSDGQLRRVFTAGDARFRGVVETLVRDGQEAGTIASEVDPAIFAVVFVGLLRGIAAQFLVAPGDVGIKAARAECARWIRSSLAPARTSPTVGPTQ